MRRALAYLVFALGCKNAVEPEAHCTEQCVARAQSRCSERECSRGCAFIIDRIVEHQDDNVLACVAGGQGRCDDRAFAECAAKIGIHADGGPGAPEPLPEDEQKKNEDSLE